MDKIKVYWDYEVVSLPPTLGGGDEVQVTLYPTKEKETLHEWVFDEKELFDSVNMEFFMSVEHYDPEFPLFDEIGDYDEQYARVWEEAKKRGVLEKWLCQMFNDGDSDYEPDLCDLWDKAHELAEAEGK